MILTPRPTPMTALTWSREAAMLVGEASTIGPFERVYDDACDVGFTLISEDTYEQIVLAIDHEERDADGDVVYWNLVPVKPASATVRVRIYND